MKPIKTGLLSVILFFNILGIKSQAEYQQCSQPQFYCSSSANAAQCGFAYSITAYCNQFLEYQNNAAACEQGGLEYVCGNRAKCGVTEDECNGWQDEYGGYGTSQQANAYAYRYPIPLQAPYPGKYPAYPETYPQTYAQPQMYAPQPGVYAQQQGYSQQQMYTGPVPYAQPMPYQYPMPVVQPRPVYPEPYPRAHHKHKPHSKSPSSSQSGSPSHSHTYRQSGVPSSSVRHIKIEHGNM